MPTIAYLANQFPAAVEPYVFDEILALRKRGVEVIASSGRRVPTKSLPAELCGLAEQSFCVQDADPWLWVRAAWFLVCRFSQVWDLLARIVVQGHESPGRRLRALAHTWLGACYAVRLRDSGVQHIHAHHGYFASWMALVAARLLDIGFSLTLHGSDLLLSGSYLDTKLENCTACFTVSEFNRRHILDKYPRVEPGKIIVQRLGVTVPPAAETKPEHQSATLTLLAVGRLHPVKDHAFLIRACFELKQRGIGFHCQIAGEGTERKRLQQMIAERALAAEVELLGHVEPSRLDEHYRQADIVVLTSLSEGLPLVLMEAMARGRIVLAPALNGIPELVIDGRTGFLYSPGSIESFVARIELIRSLEKGLEAVAEQAKAFVNTHYQRERNLECFCNLLLALIPKATEVDCHEDPVLQQI